MDIINASGAIARNDFVRRDKHAELYYEQIRKRTSDIKAISKNTGFSVKDVTKIKNHVFFNKYNLDGAKLKSFDPDFDMAVSWQRLIDGESIQEMGIVLLKHELMELKLMKQGLSYRDAHDLTEVKYSYAKYIKELNEKGGVF